MIAQYTAAALASENKVLAHPSSADSIPTSAPTRRTTCRWAPICGAACPDGRWGTCEQILAIELLCAAQALDLRLAALRAHGRRSVGTGPGRGVAGARRPAPASAGVPAPAPASPRRWCASASA